MATISPVTQNSAVVSPPSGLDVRAAQSGVSVQVKAKIAPDPNAQAKTTEKPITERDVQKAIAEATQDLGGASETIGFSYVEKINRLYVQIKDNASGEVIREIPSKEFIQHQIAMHEMVGMILDKKA